MVRQKNRRIQSGSGFVGSFDEARSQLGILSGPHDVKVDSIFETRSSARYFKELREIFSSAKRALGQDRRYSSRSSRGSRNPLFMEFTNLCVDKFSTSLTFMWLRRSPEKTFPPLKHFISLHQASGGFPSSYEPHLTHKTLSGQDTIFFSYTYVAARWVSFVCACPFDDRPVDLVVDVSVL